jgi:hypothetical protein
MKNCPKCNTEHNKSGIFCSRSCANSRQWTEEDKKKKSESVKKNFLVNGHPGKGKSGWKHSDEMKEIKRQLSLQLWDRLGRRTEHDKIIKNRVGVSKYRAKKKNLTPDNANCGLIKEIYKHCPKGYEVDHIIALAEGGLHHENNLQYLPAMENRKKNRTQNYDKNLVIKWQDVVKFGV